VLIGRLALYDRSGAPSRGDHPYHCGLDGSRPWLQAAEAVGATREAATLVQLEAAFREPACLRRRSLSASGSTPRRRR
jgi:hypothetical protein